MWVFYLISLPLTLGLVMVTLWYFAGPDVPRYVLFTVGYTWFCSLSFIILVPADIWTTMAQQDKGGITFFWSWSYWSTFALTWAVVPAIQGYEDAGDFTMKERLKTSIHVNLVFYLIVGSIGLLGLLLLIIMHRNWSANIVVLAMACSNTFGLVTGAFLLGFGLSEIPKGIWRNADWSYHHKFLSHRVAKMAVKLDDAHQEFSNAIVVAQATSKQMSKRDPLRPCMNVIDNMLVQMFREDPSFKPSGGRLGENDMEYDTDEKTMATLRRQLKRAREEYYRYKSEYLTYVIEALELEDTIKNYGCRDSTGWLVVEVMEIYEFFLRTPFASRKYISCIRGSRTGKLGSLLDTMEFVHRCILSKQLKRCTAVLLGCLSAAILLAEATILPSGVDLSLFSILISAVGKQEMLSQIAAFVPLMYMCICTYYSLFKIGMLMFYSLTSKQTSSVSLLMICSMVARYAPPISYNFLNLIRLNGDEKTVFEKRMGNIDDAVPFFGKGFNKIYPLIMVIYTALVACNFFGRVIEFFGSWKRFKIQNDEADMNDGFDPSGIIIIQKERSWLEEGRKIGEQVIPLARNFNNVSVDLESTVLQGNQSSEVISGGHLIMEDAKRAQKERNLSYGREFIASKYTSVKERLSMQPSVARLPKERGASSASVSLLGPENTNTTGNVNGSSIASGLSTKWASMKSGFQILRSSMEARKFLPLRQTQEGHPFRSNASSSSDFLDEIFQRLKQRPNRDPNGDGFGYEDDEDGSEGSVPSR